jgi:hypothetical protein
MVTVGDEGAAPKKIIKAGVHIAQVRTHCPGLSATAHPRGAGTRIPTAILSD